MAAPSSSSLVHQRVPAKRTRTPSPRTRTHTRTRTRTRADTPTIKACNAGLCCAQRNHTATQTQIGERCAALAAQHAQRRRSMRGRPEETHPHCLGSAPQINPCLAPTCPPTKKKSQTALKQKQRWLCCRLYRVARHYCATRWQRHPRRHRVAKCTLFPFNLF